MKVYERLVTVILSQVLDTTTMVSEKDSEEKTHHVTLSQNTEEKVRGKGLESVWSDENG